MSVDIDYELSLISEDFGSEQIKKAIKPIGQVKILSSIFVFLCSLFICVLGCFLACGICYIAISAVIEREEFSYLMFIIMGLMIAFFAFFPIKQCIYNNPHYVITDSNIKFVGKNRYGSVIISRSLSEIKEMYITKINKKGVGSIYFFYKWDFHVFNRLFLKLFDRPFFILPFQKRLHFCGIKGIKNIRDVNTILTSLNPNIRVYTKETLWLYAR